MSLAEKLGLLSSTVTTSRSGIPTLKLGNRYLLSPYDPLREAMRIAGALAGEKVALVGLGLGHLARALGSRLERVVCFEGELDRHGCTEPSAGHEVDRDRIHVCNSLKGVEQSAALAAASGIPVVVDPSVAAAPKLFQELKSLIAMVAQCPRITFIHLKTAGDVLRSLGAVHLYKRIQPRMTVEFITERPYGDLLRMCPDVDVVTEIGPGASLAVPRPMLGVNFGCDARSAEILEEIRPIWAIGFRSADGQLTLCDERNPRYAGELATLRNRMNRYHFYQRMLGLDFSFDVPPIAIPPMEPIARGEYRVVQFGAGSEQDVWSAKRLSPLVLGEAIRSMGGRWIAAGSAEEAARARLAGIRDEDNFCGRTDFFQLAALLYSARLYIGHDSGPTHLAAMLGVPTVALFGFTSPILNAPIGFRTLVIQADLSCAFRGCPAPCPDVTCISNYDGETIRLAAAFLNTEEISSRLDIAADLRARGVRYFPPRTPVEDPDPMRSHLIEESRLGLPRDLALSLTREWLELEER